MKRNLSLILLIPSILLSGCTQALAPTEAPEETQSSVLVTHYPGQSVECDTDVEHKVTWKLEDGVLTYSGHGDIWETTAEWTAEAESVREVVFEYGIEGNYTDLFCGLPNLTKVTAAETMGVLGSLHDCPSLTEVILKNPKIQVSGFSGCTALTDLILSQEETSIGGFQGCTGLTDLNIPDRIKSIDAGAFEDCTALKDITIPGNISYIGEMAFGDCTGLERVTVEEGVGFIEYYAFANCTSLKEVYLPSTVQTHMFAFDNCPALTKIVVHPDNPWITVNENNEIVYK